MALVWRKRDLDRWQRLVVILLYPLIRMTVKRRWIGQRHIPASGGALIVTNHVADVVDPLAFAMFLYDSGRFPHYLAKDSLFRIRVVGRALRGVRQIPVYRGTADAKDALRDAIAALERGDAVVIYPEGSVTADPDWWPMVPRTGVARLALETTVPVIPVAQWGAQRVYDRHRRRVSLFPRKTVTVLAGPPVDLAEYRDRPVTRELLREVADRVMGEVRDQLAQIRNERPPAEFHPNPRRRPGGSGRQAESSGQTGSGGQVELGGQAEVAGQVELGGQAEVAGQAGLDRPSDPDQPAALSEPAGPNHPTEPGTPAEPVPDEERS